MQIRRCVPMRWSQAITLLVLLTGCGRDTVSPERAIPSPQLPDLSATYPEVAEAVRGRFKIVENHPNSAGAWGRYGMTLDAHEFREQSVVCYSIASRLDPGDIRWRYYLAMQLRNSDPDQALAIVEAASTGNQGGLPVLLLKVALFREQGRNAEAEQALRAALKTDESNPAVVIELARLLFEQQNSEAAKLLLLSLQSPGSSIAPFKEAAVLLGKIEVTLGNTADGEKLILQSVELPSIQIAVDDVFHRELAAGRRDPLWMGQLAVMKARGGDDVAVMRLRDLVARYPELVANRIHLAMLMMDEGKLGQAKDLLQGGLESGSDDSRLLMGLAAVCIEQKDWKAAEGHLRSLLLVDAANVSGNSDLAFVLEQQGRHNEAAAAYRQTLDLSPTSRQVRERLEVLEKTTR